MLSFIPIRDWKHRSNWDKHKRNNPKLASSPRCYRILLYFDSARDGSLGNDETRYSRSFGEAILPLDACLSSFPAYWCPKFPSLTQASVQFLFPFVRTCLFIINQNIAGCKCSPCLHLVADSWFFMALRLHSDGFFRTSCTELSKTNPAKGLLQTSANFQRTRLFYGSSKFHVLDTCTIALLQPCKCDSIEITIDYWTSVLVNMQRGWQGD